MTDRDLLSLTLKVTGFVWLLRVVSTVHSTLRSLSFLHYKSGGHAIYSQAYELRVMGSLAITVLIAVGLLVFADALSRLVIRCEEPVPTTVFVEWSKTVFAVAIMLIGVVTVLLGIEQLYAAVVGALRIGEPHTGKFVTVGYIPGWSNVVQAGVAILVGVCLAAYARKVVYMTYNPKEYFSKVKEYHTRKESDS